MLDQKDIDYRNKLLVDFVDAMDMGLHVIKLGDKPRLVNKDFTIQYCAYVDNFHLILLKGTSGEEYLNIRLKPLRNMLLMELKQAMALWSMIYKHDKIYTIYHSASGCSLGGLSGLESNIPNFTKTDPIIYYEADLHKAESMLRKLSIYNLIIK